LVAVVAPLRAKKIFSILLLCLGIALVVCACQTSVRKRPPGWFKLGKVVDFSEAETYLADKRLLLRKDARGFSVMSTECTHDLSALLPKKTNAGVVFFSEYSDSQYAEDGKVLHGPAVQDLPYFELRIDESVYGGPKDALYVQVGTEVPKDWRLAVP
jgi:nitrite reductase/ring-hydroxylating ferredoxin subunit